jgi:hypothetical protein
VGEESTDNWTEVSIGKTATFLSRQGAQNATVTFLDSFIFGYIPLLCIMKSRHNAEYLIYDLISQRKKY